MMQGFDELWPSGPRFLQTEEGFKLSTDSVLLADFTNTAKMRRCLDLGSGAGVLCVLLAEKAPEMEILGLELQPDFVDLSRRNLAENGLMSRVHIQQGDLRLHRELFSAGSFDLVVSNPPYFAAGSGYSAPEAARAAAREEISCSLSELCAAARWALRWGGRFSLVHRPERLSEIFCAMSEAGIEPKRLRTVAYSSEKAPSLVLVEGLRGGNKGLHFAPPLVLTRDGKDSPEAERIYRRGIHRPRGKGERE